MSKQQAQAEASARVAAVLHNTGGTYAGATRIYGGFRPATLSRWNRQLNAPRTENMEMLRAVTS